MISTADSSCAAKACLLESAVHTRPRSIEDEPALGLNKRGVETAQARQPFLERLVIMSIDAREDPHLSSPRALDVDADRADGPLVGMERTRNDGLLPSGAVPACVTIVVC